MTDETERSSGPGGPLVDVREHGAEGQVLDRRLFFQLLVLRAPPGAYVDDVASRLADALAAADVPSVVYDDVNDPRGLGLLTLSEDPSVFVARVRSLLSGEGLRDLTLRDDMTMLGRTYGSGHEPDLEHWVLHKPRQNVMDPECPWAIWYPLRRTGEFARLPPREQGSVLREHGVIGRAYAMKDLARDVRLACHGLDRMDNEFVIGLIGKELHPLSHVVQRMRSTKQTSQYIQSMGPFFVGHARSRHAGR